MFNRNKIEWGFQECEIPVTTGQIEFEIQHLKNKLLERDPIKLKVITSSSIFQTHPLFSVVEGAIEDWEVTK